MEGLGAPLGGPVEVVVTSAGALAELLAKELAAERAQITGGPRGEDLKKVEGVGAALWEKNRARIVVK